MTRRILWDDRYRGRHGIARFAREVSRRLTTPRSELQRGLTAPMTSFDVAALTIRLSLNGRCLFASPGFSAALDVGRFRQLLTVHDLIHLEVPEESTSAKRTYYNRILRPVLRRTNLVMTVSEFSRNRIHEWTGLALDNIINVGNGCSLPLLSASDDHSSTALRGYILFVGNERPHKNLDLLMAAMATLQHDFQAVLVGVTEKTVARLCWTHQVSPAAVEVTGPISDETLSDLYTHAAALCVPSTYEGFGLIALEAMARGTPTVYTCEAVHEVVADLGTRALSTTDPAAYAAAVRSAVEVKPTMQDSLVARAATFDWNSVAARVEGAMLRAAS